MRKWEGGRDTGWKRERERESDDRDSAWARSFRNICLGLLSVINVAVIENYFHFYAYHYQRPLQLASGNGQHDDATANWQQAGRARMRHGHSLNAFTFAFTISHSTFALALRYYRWGIIVCRDLSALFISFCCAHSIIHTLMGTEKERER